LLILLSESKGPLEAEHRSPFHRMEARP